MTHHEWTAADFSEPPPPASPPAPCPASFAAPRPPRRSTFQASWINDAEFTGYFVAIDEGYYAAEGLDLTYLSGGPDVIPESTLISGTADLTLTTPDTTIKAIVDQGAPFKIIGTQYQKNPIGIVSLAKAIRSTRRPTWSARRWPCRRSTSSRSRRC